MPVESIDVQLKETYWDGHEFGDTGRYDRIDAVVRYAVDPTDPANNAITDLALAARDDDGMVRFQGDMTILMPADPAKGNRSLLLEVPNRGRYITGYINHDPGKPVPDRRILPGDGFLMEQGWTIAWVGWQWDVPRTPERLRIGLTAPQVPLSRRDGEPLMQLRLLLDSDVTHIALTDQHVGSIGGHTPIPPLDPNDTNARLLVRDSIYGSAEEIPFENWSFGRNENGAIVKDNDHVQLTGGFKAGRIYDLMYQPRDCPVVGAGLLAIRDAATWLRRHEDSPLKTRVDTVVGEGVSQCGRFLRHFLKLGLNHGFDGQPVFDGVLSHVAGSRVGEFNHRHAQPSVQPTPSFGHLFPFSDEPQTDPLTLQTAGLLDRQATLGSMPRIIYTNTAAEYWRSDGALAHTNLNTGADVDPPPHVRQYLFAGTPHSPGLAELENINIFGSKSANVLNMLDWRPLYRACLENLRAWIVDGIEPPPSQFPRASNNSRIDRTRALNALASIPDLALPDPERLTQMHPLDLGRQTDDGIAVFPALHRPETYPEYVSALDVDGNEIAGVRMPDQLVPIATHTGFNPRHPENGGSHLMQEYFGSSIPFATTKELQQLTGDPRQSLEARYRSIDDYMSRVNKAALALVQQRHLLERDVPVCLEIARDRYKAVVDGSD